MSRPDHLFFLHIPKTAGSTLHNILIRQFPKNLQVETNVFKNKNDPSEFPEEKRKKFRLIRGHFPFGIHQLFGNDSFEYTTMLREPIDRCISHYYYIRNRRKHHGIEGAMPLDHSLKELCENGEFIFVDNMQVRFLSGNTEVPFGKITEQMLQDAISNLEKYFPVIGVQEEFNAYILLLAERYNFKRTYYRNQRVSVHRKKTNELDSETRIALEKCNALDIQLYNYVKEKVYRQLSERGESFRSEINKFEKRNKLATKIVNLIPFFPKPKAGTD
jgi:hypothetical protein